MNDSLSHLWSEGQKAAYCELVEMGTLFFFNDWKPFPIQPRLSPLVVGPSGSGKSHLIRSVSQELGLPCLRLTPSNWIVSGAKGIPTLYRVYEFIRDNEKGIVACDELDKFQLGQSDWSRYVIGELFDLLDRTLSQPIKEVEWTAEILRKLRYDFLVIGSGTWQQLWTSASKPKLGFGNSDDSPTMTACVRQSVETTDVIPMELLRRFNRHLIVLPPATESDYRIAAERGGLTKLAAELHSPLDFALAARSQLGARWLEEQMAQLLLLARRAGRTDLIGLRPYVPDEPIEPEDLFMDEEDEPVL
jgi:SpoVK/Ycf46/Vps4 family AAA+-type ATPase